MASNQVNDVYSIRYPAPHQQTMRPAISHCIALVSAIIAWPTSAQNLGPMRLPQQLPQQQPQIVPPAIRLPLHIQGGATGTAANREYGTRRADRSSPASDPVQSMTQLYGELPQAAPVGKGCSVTVP